MGELRINSTTVGVYPTATAQAVKKNSAADKTTAYPQPEDALLPVALKMKSEIELEYLGAAPRIIKVDELEQRINLRVADYQSLLGLANPVDYTAGEASPAQPPTSATSTAPKSSGSDTPSNSVSSSGAYWSSRSSYILYQLYYIIVPQQLQDIGALNMILAKQREDQANLMQEQMDNLHDYTKEAMKHIINSAIISWSGALGSGLVSIGGACSGSVAQYKSMKLVADVKLNEFDAKLMNGQNGVSDYKNLVDGVWSNDEIQGLVSKHDASGAVGAGQLGAALKVKTDAVAEVNKNIKTELAKTEHPVNIRKDSLAASATIVKKVDDLAIASGNENVELRDPENNQEYNTALMKNVMTQHEADIIAYNNLSNLDEGQVRQLNFAAGVQSDVLAPLVKGGKLELYNYQENSHSLDYLDFSGENIVLRKITRQQNADGTLSDNYELRETVLGSKANLPALSEFIDSRKANTTYLVKNYSAVEFLHKFESQNYEIEYCYSHPDIARYHSLVQKGVDAVTTEPLLRLSLTERQQLLQPVSEAMQREDYASADQLLDTAGGVAATGGPAIDAYKNGLTPEEVNFVNDFELNHPKTAGLIRQSTIHGQSFSARQRVASEEYQFEYKSTGTTDGMLVAKELPIIGDRPIIRVIDKTYVTDVALEQNVADKAASVLRVTGKAGTADTSFNKASAYMQDLARADNQAKNLEAHFKQLAPLEAGFMKQPGFLRQQLSVNHEKEKAKWQFVSSLSMFTNTFATMTRDSLQSAAELEQQKSRNTMAVGEALSSLYQSLESTSRELSQNLSATIQQLGDGVIEIARKEADGINRAHVV